MAPRVTVGWIPPGGLGTVATLQRMRQLVTASLVKPRVVQTARAITAECPERDGRCRALLIRRWLDEHLRFVPDPRGVELVVTPEVLLEQIERGYYTQGDCDDAAVLGAALAKAIGLRARFVVLGFLERQGPWRHVYAAVQVGPSVWVDLDVTRPPDWRRAPATRMGTMEV
jgi:transglutaminase-like putative cysteine protease